MNRRIPYGDVRAQAARMTEHMRAVMLEIEEGVNTYGRVIAQEFKIPYPQAYNTLNVLHARGFLTYEYGDGANDKRKVYRLTKTGKELLDAVDGIQLPGPHPKRAAGPRNPEEYARRMRAGTLATWLIRLGMVDSYEELEHVSTCTECTDLIKKYGLRGDVRCEAYTDRANGPDNGQETTP